MNLDPRRVFFWHMLAIAALAAGHLLVVIALRDVAPFNTEKVRTFFDLDVEAAPGAYFTALSWLAVAGAALLNARGAPDVRRFWFAAAAVATFLSIDEAVRIHERFVTLGEILTPATGIFTISWWVVYPVVLVPALPLVLPGFLRLGRPLQMQLVVAGAVFCIGAVGMEMAESHAVQAFAIEQGLWHGRHTDWDAFKAMLDHRGEHHLHLMSWYALIEETLEMVGVALALRAMLHRAAVDGADVRISVRADGLRDSVDGEAFIVGRRR